MGEGIREALVRRWLSGERDALATIVAAHPALADDPSTLVELVQSELALRYSIGEQPSLSEYAARFPQCARLLGVSPPPSAPTAAAAHPADDSVSCDTGGTQVVNAADLPSVVISPPNAVPPPAPAPPDVARRLADLYGDLPVGEGSMQIAVPADLLRGRPAAPTPAIESRAADSAPAPATPAVPAASPLAENSAPSFDTVQSLGDVQSYSAVIERLSTPKLQIPGYEIQKELGRGGMGVVYRARQLSADRIVALKVIRNDVLDTLPDDTRSSTIERFRHEAQAAAKIEHDHLVSVYEIGDSDGLRYYAMRFVDGKSLYELLREGPLDNRRAAAYLEPVCRAIHAIHEHGVLHRDLKPHNIMIDRRGDRPLVTDFGLAKFVGSRDELTHAGAVMGTPSYMSPEQALDSGKVGPLADVYSLGATLYHTLTGRAPFQAAHVADTLRQILRDDPIRPRQLNPAVDRDLETICLKSLLKEPEKRYASAAAMADDLARYLRGEPILARPLGAFGRAWRWCRRNRLVASLYGVAASLALVAVSAVVIAYFQTARALEESNASLLKALTVVDEFCTSVAEDDLKNLPGFQPLRKDLLQRAQKYYASFLAEGRADPSLKDELGRAYFRMGVIQDELGQGDDALASLEAARELQRSQLRDVGADERRLRALGDTLNYLGIRLQKVRRYDEAMQSLDEARQLRDRLADDFPDAAELQRGSANTRMNLGLVEWARGRDEKSVARLAEARRLIEQAQERRSRFLPQAGESRRAVERDLARGYYSLAQVGFLNWKLTSDAAEAGGEPGAAAARRLAELARQIESDFEETRRRFVALIDETPELMDRYQLAVCLNQLGDFRFLNERDAEAIASFTEAREQFETLARENPTVVSYARELAETIVRIGDAHKENGRRDEARAEFQQALELLAKIRAKSSDDDQAAAELKQEVEALLAELGQ